MSREPWNTGTGGGTACEDMPRIIPTFDQYPTFCNTPYTVKIEITKRLGLVLMVKGRKLLLMYRQDLSILALLFCLHRFV